MASPTGKRPDRFHVGQRVILAMPRYTGWASMNGERGIVVAQREYGCWTCNSIDGSRPRGEQRGWRYAVLTARGEHHYLEEHLRAGVDGDVASTWAKFKRATGVDIRKAPTVAKSRRTRSPQSVA